MITDKQPDRVLELYEILEKVQSTKSRKDKVALLQQHNQAFLTDYLRCVFDDVIQFNLPGGKVPYTPAEEESVPSTWRKKNVELQYFVKGLKGDKMLQLKRETKFISLLESIHPKDAELIADMISKKTPIKGLTKKLVQEAYPKLISK